NISVSNNPTATIRVTLNSSLTSADVRVLEYTGFSSAAVTVDNWAGNSGTAANQFEAGGIPGGLTSRGINTGFADIAMDSNGAVGPGSYSAGANVIGGWAMQVAGFSISGITT